MKINIKVQPNSSKEEIIKIDECNYKVYLTKQPEDNKANNQLIKLLKKKFKLSPKIIKGHTSKNKVILLE